MFRVKKHCVDFIRCKISLYEKVKSKKTKGYNCKKECLKMVDFVRFVRYGKSNVKSNLTIYFLEKWRKYG